LGAHARAIATSGGTTMEGADAAALTPAPVAELEELRRAFVTAEQALRRHEAELQVLVNASPVGILHVDLSGGVLATNDVFPRMLGTTREELLDGRWRWNKMTAPEWQGVTERAIAEAMAAPDGICTPYEKEYVRADGTRLPALN